ncbi:MAG: 30S ribosomal protein S15 [Candidatus Nanoarchaeia archaeon]|nr:30S ribosomal protein S15 [Candidatus Nanoarchaeia archaeon]MDD5587908.1 30S ribosomal protein S15 [Candidatus Nanoarchaeia archaeon]
MARMYGHIKGQSGSKKPFKKIKPTWLKYDSKEVEQIIIKLFKEEKTPSQIGIILRDVYGIPDVSIILKKKLLQVLKDHDLSTKLPEDLTALIKTQIKLNKHVEKNKKDMSAKRGLILAESKINRLINYYKKIGRLPKDWKYSQEAVKLIMGG